MGPDQTVEMMRKVLMEAMLLSAPLLVAACVVSLVVSLLQTLDQRAGADADGCAAAGRGLCRDDGSAAMDGASAGRVSRCICLQASTGTWDRDA